MILRSGRHIFQKQFASKKRRPVDLKTSKIASYNELLQQQVVDPKKVKLIPKSIAKPEIGRSVVAMCDMKMSEVVCSYGGQIVNNEQAEKLFQDENPQRSAYLFCLHSNCAIDGYPELPESVGHLGIFVNDPRGIEGQFENLYWSVKRTGTESARILLRARRNIKKGEELWISYGPNYW